MVERYRGFISAGDYRGPADLVRAGEFGLIPNNFPLAVRNQARRRLLTSLAQEGIPVRAAVGRGESGPI